MYGIGLYRVSNKSTYQDIKIYTKHTYNTKPLNKYKKLYK